MYKRIKQPGFFVISLDFELMWGMFDKVDSETYGDALRGVGVVVPRLLSLFQERNIHATWATVGMLTAYHRAELLKLTPLEHERPTYVRTELSAYEHMEKFAEQMDAEPDLYLAPELVEQIVHTPGQELASHSFSHYYCLEELESVRSDVDTFAADAVAIHNAFRRFNTEPVSMVFPRNQWTTDALRILERLRYVCYRGTERSFIYRAQDEYSKTKLFLRALRFLDRYINLTGHHTYHVTLPEHSEPQLINIPASRQLHPYHRLLFWLEPLKLWRIKRGMSKAARRGQVFHLWWHPHNFGRNQAKNVQLLESILDHYQKLHERYQWQSATMKEVAIAAGEPLGTPPAATASQNAPKAH